MLFCFCWEENEEICAKKDMKILNLAIHSTEFIFSMVWRHCLRKLKHFTVIIEDLEDRELSQPLFEMARKQDQSGLPTIFYGVSTRKSVFLRIKYIA